MYLFLRPGSSTLPPQRAAGRGTVFKNRDEVKYIGVMLQ
jgi:hypothetical protein